MKRLAIAALAVLALGAVIAGAQVVTNPAIPPNSVCSYLTSPPTLTNGQASWLRCDSTGALITTSGGGGGGTAVTVADGADVAEGATTDAAATAGSTGTLSAKLRLMTTQLASIITNQGAPTTTPIQGAVNVTPTDCSGTIASGGVAQNAFTANAGRHGFTIANIDATEVLWISMTTTAAASGTGSYPLGPADATTFTNLNSFTSPTGLGINTALSVIAATTSHKFTCTVW